MTTACHFTDASVLLSELIRRWESDLHELSRCSEEMARHWRDRIHATWSQWPAVTGNFRKAAENLPKELRRRDFLKSFLSELERYEEAAKAFLALYLEGAEGPRAYWHKRMDTFTALLEPVRDRAGRLSLSIAELQHHPLVLKSLRGEAILGSRNRVQWGRKIGHISSGLCFLYLFEYAGIEPLFKGAVWIAFLAFACGLETARHLNPKVNGLVCRVFGVVMREREKHQINSAVFFILSMSVVYFFFPRDVSVLTMLFIAVADPLAGVIGVHFGRHKLSSHCSWEGTFACFAACAILSAAAIRWMFTDNALTPAGAFLFSLYAGLVGAAAEASFKRLDDNLIMPIVSAPLLWAGLRLVGA